MKILYVCPLAHYVGHYPFVALKEPQALAGAGADVTLLTFQQPTDNVTVPLKVVLPRGRHTAWLHGLLGLLRRKTLSRWVAVAVEITLTELKALWLCRRGNYDAIYLRDGDPFYFLPLLMSLPLRNVKWVVSVTAANIYPPDKRMERWNPVVRIYNLVLRLVNSRMWAPTCRLGLKRNRFRFVVQNDSARSGLERYMGGVFGGLVACIPLGTDMSSSFISKAEAREFLGLPQNKMLLLSFGAPHVGKDLGTVFRAVEELGDWVFLVHAGRQAFNLARDAASIVESYKLDGKVKIFDYWVPEHVKPCFFYAADALVLSYNKAFVSTSSLLYEAAKYRLPVLASDANELGETVNREGLGLCFEAERWDSLAGAVRAFRELDDIAIGRVQDALAQFAANHSLEEWAKRTLGVLK